MKKHLSRLCVLTLVLACISSVYPQQTKPTPRRSRTVKPKLVVVIVMDQFRADYLTRFAPWFGEGGFKWLMRHGAYLTNTHYSHATTYTGPGHAQILSGSFGHTNGIIGNKWYNRQTGRVESMFYDPDSTLIGLDTTSDDETSPRNFIGNNLSDQLRLANHSKSKAIALSLKDRAAIMLAGKLGTAYWYHETKGEFLSSTFYMKDLPDWVKAFNAKKIPERSFNRQWEKALPAAAYDISTRDDGLGERDFKGLGKTFPHRLTDASGRPAPDFYEAFTATPFATEYELEFAREVIEREHLGTDLDPDLLGISITATDICGHAYGCYSQEIQDLVVQTDRQLADFFAYLNRRFKPGELVIALTADHGATPMPELMQSLGVEAGRIRKKELKEAVDEALDAQFGPGDWTVALEDPGIFLNQVLVAEKKLDRALVEQTAAEAVMKVKGIAASFTRTQILNGSLPPSRLARMVEKSFYPGRSGDVITVTKPFYFWGTYGERNDGSTHGSPYEYDSHVPLIILAQPVKPGTYTVNTDVTDLAPTLCSILNIAAPAGTEGRVLQEILRTSRETP